MSTSTTNVNTWCDDCEFLVTVQCRQCKQKLNEHKDTNRFVFCKCDNAAGLARIENEKVKKTCESYLITGKDTDGTLVRMSRSSCPKGCKARNETICYTLFQWQDLRQQFRTTKT
jgi:hypothetical protein